MAGLGRAWREERNFRIETGLAVLAVTAGILLHLSTMEWLLVILCIGMVLAGEGFNTAIERLADLYTTEHNERIKGLKDIAAGSVLLLAIAALAVGVFIFGPRLLHLIGLVLGNPEMLQLILFR